MLQGDSGCLPIYEVITDQPIRLLRKTPSILAGVFSVSFANGLYCVRRYRISCTL